MLVVGASASSTGLTALGFEETGNPSEINSTTREVCVGRKKTGPKIQVGVAASCAETRHSFFEREKRILIRVWHSKRLAAKGSSR
jgi:hypothetical protein